MSQQDQVRRTRPYLGIVGLQAMINNPGIQQQRPENNILAAIVLFEKQKLSRGAA